MNKWQTILESKNVSKIFKACKTIHALEDLFIELETDQIYTDLEEGTIWVPYISREEKEVVSQISSAYEDYDISIKLGDPPHNTMHYRDAYRFYNDFFLVETNTILKEMIERTKRNKNEYALVISSEKPIGVILEGEEESITLPEIRACVFVHTHPNESCFPSKKDIKSSLSFFMNGGITEVILSNRCQWILWRDYLLDENDVFALIELEKKINKFYEKRDFLQRIKEMLLKTNIKYELRWLW